MLNLQNNQTAYLIEHIKALSDPVLEGRLSGMPGAQKAASYLVDQLKSLGVLPFEANEYLQPLTVPATRLTGPVTLKVGAWNLKHRIDFGEMRLSSGGAHRGKLMLIRDGETVKESLEYKIILIPQKPENFDLEATVKAGVQLGIRGLLYEEGEPQWFPKTSAVFANLGVPVIRVRKSVAEELVRYEGNIAAINLPTETDSRYCNNVIGMLPGRKAGKTIALTAHYDHVGDDPGGYRFSGALDNASGVAVILELIRKLRLQEKALPYNILVCFLTGEESGHWGAKHFMQHLPFPLSAIINFDVLGLDPDFGQIRIGQLEHNHWLSETTVKLLQKYGVSAKIQRGRDDAAFFNDIGIPTIGFGESSLHNIGPRIHTPDDRVEALQLEPLTRTLALTVELLRALSFHIEG